jgi:anti-anti-sigma factor
MIARNGKGARAARHRFMQVQEKRFAGVTVLQPAGRLDHANSPRFQDQLLRALEGPKGTVPVVIDMAGLEYVSSAGLRALMVGAKRAKGSSGALAVAALTPLVREVFSISRFDKVLPVHDTLRAALAALSADAAKAFDAA